MLTRTPPRADWKGQFSAIAFHLKTEEQYNNAIELARTTPKIGQYLEVKQCPVGLQNLPKPIIRTMKEGDNLYVEGMTYPLKLFLKEVGFQWIGSGSSRYSMTMSHAAAEDMAMQDLSDLCSMWGWQLNPPQPS